MPPVEYTEPLELLLQIADNKDSQKYGLSDEHEASSGTSLIESPLFKEYSLDIKDLRVIALLFDRLLDGKDSITTPDILKGMEVEKKESIRELGRIQRLSSLGIVEPVKGKYDDDCLNGMASLLRSSIRLTGAFLNRIFSPYEEDTSITDIKPYMDNLEYLAEQFARVKLLHELKQDRERGLSSSCIRKEELLKRLEGDISLRLGKTDKIFPFEAFKKEKSLSPKEELIILILIESEVSQKGYYIERVLELISRTPYERLTDIKLFEKDGRLIREGIILIDIFVIKGEVTKFIKLNKDLKARFFEEKKEKKIRGTRIDELIPEEDNGFFEVIKPTVSLDKVVLHPKTTDDITLAIESIQGKGSELLSCFGINGFISGAQKERGKVKRKGNKHAPVTMLFYGGPGTGKSLTAHAIAHSLHRDILTFDCSRILGMYVGESEKSTRRIFDKYREISKGKKNPPVLLLNEADQFLHKRIEATRSTDYMYNQMQNIFLEQLERFEGVLIATTNLIENMDLAFSRRFHHKIEFRRPESKERLKLWQIHIPERVPLAEDVDLDYLAKKYDLSGGQISVVVRNAATRGTRRGNKLCQEDFILACENEMAGSFEEKGSRIRIGF